MSDGNRRSSNLDIMFTNEEIVESMKYVQKTDSWESDHFPVIMRVKSKTKGKYCKKYCKVL